MLPQQIYAQVNKEIEPYVNFLNEKNNISAKDYILSLFEENDLVILCERDHREMLQYDLILDVVRDPYFVENVGHIFTEVGPNSIESELNSFLKNSELTEKEINDQVLSFQRRCMFPIWEKPSYSKFIKGLHQINNGLPYNRKVMMFPTDVIYVEGEPTEDKVVEMFQNMKVRDSLMASYIEDKLSQNKISKALIIMNYRHAYRYDMTENGFTSQNAGRFLFEKYPGKVANVLINTYNNDKEFAAVNNGKWDASFKASEIENTGFDFENSPFGEDPFEGWVSNPYRYKDIFTGFVFYMPIEQFQLAFGVDHIMEDGFYDEYVIRDRMFRRGINKLRNVEEPIPEPNKDEVWVLNKTKISSLHTLNRVKASIQKWLNE